MECPRLSCLGIATFLTSEKCPNLSEAVSSWVGWVEAKGSCRLARDTVLMILYMVGQVSFGKARS